MSNGLIVYRGPSQYDGTEIVAILTRGSKNSKTGSMAQLWILSTRDNPIKVNRMGWDYGICGNCIYRGTPNPDASRGWAKGRTCYVNLEQAPGQIHRAFKRGSYPVAETVGQVAEFLSGLMLRVGAYGDPAALPPALPSLLVSMSSGHTAYTHGASVSEHYAQQAAHYAMISADNAESAAAAQKQGYRTFRMISIAQWEQQGRQSLLSSEILCPASAEAGYRTQCDTCGLCNGADGASPRSIAIVEHGIGRKKKMKLPVKPLPAKECRHPGHHAPTMLYVPAGRTHVHVCPSCGHKEYIMGYGITM